MASSGQRLGRCAGACRHMQLWQVGETVLVINPGKTTQDLWWIFCGHLGRTIPGGPYLVNQPRILPEIKLQWNETGVFIQYTCFLFELGGLCYISLNNQGNILYFFFFGAHLFFYYLWLYAIFNLYVDFYRFIVHRGFYVLGLVFIEVHSMEIRVWTCHKDVLVKYCYWYWYMPWHCSGLSNCIGGV